MLRSAQVVLITMGLSFALVVTGAGAAHAQAADGQQPPPAETMVPPGEVPDVVPAPAEVPEAVPEAPVTPAQPETTGPPVPNPELLEVTDETRALVNDEAYLAETAGLLLWLLDDTAGFWDGRANVASGVRYQLVGEDTEVSSLCGSLRRVAAGYCSLDDHIFFGESFSVFTLNQFGDGALAYVMAHEYGHNVQAERGRAGNGDQAEVVRAELHADCLAGAYMKDLRERRLLEAGDYREAQTLAVNLADDSHGTGIQRRNALHRGFLLGAPSCWERWPLPNEAPSTVGPAPSDPALAASSLR